MHANFCIISKLYMKVMMAYKERRAKNLCVNLSSNMLNLVNNVREISLKFLNSFTVLSIKLEELFLKFVTI